MRVMASLDTDRTHRLGARAFLLFLGAGIFWIVGLSVLLGAWWWYAAPFIPKAYVIYYDYSVKLLALCLGAFVFFRLMRAYLEYRSHGYRFDDEYFHITRGYINQNEMGIVYHQIQTVTVQRSIGARMVGVARLSIVTSGTNGSHEMHLPGVEVNKARLVQRELLARSKATQHGSRKPRYEPVSFEDVDDEEEEE